MRTALDITALDNEGLGCGQHDGATVSVFGTLPGDRALVDIEHRSPHTPRAWGRLITLESPSPDRATPACPATGRCGGCLLGAWRYDAQLAWKQARVAKLLNAEVEPIFAGPPLGYRNQSKLVYAQLRGRACLGSYAPRTHQLVDAAGCRVTEPVLEEVRSALAAMLTLAPYDETTGEGELAHVMLRSNCRGEVLVTLVGPRVPELDVRGAHPAIVGVCANDGPRKNAIFGDKTRTIAGAAALTDRVGDVEVSLSPTAFFQVNREVAAAIYAAVDEWIAPSARVVDVYAGVGAIARTLARGERDVTAIEINAAAAPSDLRFIVADAAAGLAQIDRADAVVVNPPRKGLDRATVDALVKLAPAQIAYVSCNPETLARDVALLPYTIERVSPFDMHPQTPHVETLVLLRGR